MAAPRRILFVNLGEDWIRGQERVLLDIARSLDRTRFEPVVWCNAPTLARECTALGIPVQEGRFGYFLATGAGRLRLRRWLSYIRAGRALVKRHGIALIHANGPAPLQFCLPVARLAGIPVLGHLHAEEDRRSRYAFLTHLADLAVGVSRQTIAGLAADGMDPRRLRVVHNGIDPARLEADPAEGAALRRRLGIPPDATVACCVASLIRRKGHDVLLEALARLAAEGRAPHLLLAGEGPDRAALEAAAAR
ncbi:glycosyltransferase, partial [Falsiroseomonas oryzae]|uniref:glycosyltransferase n=1 Tax=Falsiroseomonas oryzae TaxID=2766473 RepID=UPI0022EB6E65